MRENHRVYGREVKGRDGLVRYDIFIKDPLNRDGAERTRKAKTIWDSNVANTEYGGIELTNIMGPKSFNYPKPTRLILQILEIASNRKSIVLDSFAGSATTAHAVLEANRRDGGERKYICIETEDYADRLTAERVRRVINGYDFQGTQKIELLREKITFTKLKKADDILHRIAAIDNLEGHKFDEIKKEVKDGELVVTGEKKVKERAEGLGGTFTFCTLGPAIELDKILTGETLPDYEPLASALFHMATNKAFEPAKLDETSSYIGESESHHLWLIYKPDLNWLKSSEAALTLSRAKAFAAAKADGKRHIVFAASRYVSQKMLNDENIPVEFVTLPNALYRIERDPT